MPGPAPSPLPPAWADAIADYLAHAAAGGAPATTRRTRRDHLAHLARSVDVGPAELTAVELLDWFAVQDWAPETRRGRRTTMRGFFAWACTSGLRDDNPALILPRVRASDPDARPAPDRVYLEAVMRAEPRVQLWLRLAGEAGLRRAEIARIHAHDLTDDLLGTSLLVHGKGRRKRLVPLSPSLAAELTAAIDEAGGGYAWPGRHGGHITPEHLGKLMARQLDGEWTAHTLRHRFAARAYRVDRDVFAVQELLGHASPATTRRYVPRADAEHLRRTVMRAVAS